MSFGIVWQYQSPDGVRVICGHPGAFCDKPEEAKDQGRTMLVALKSEPVLPLCTIEIRQDTMDKIVADCEEIYLGDDEDIFYDVTDLKGTNWDKQSWWPDTTPKE